MASNLVTEGEVIDAGGEEEDEGRDNDEEEDPEDDVGPYRICDRNH